MENLRRKLGVSIASNWTNGNTILKIGLWKWFQNNLNNQLTDAILVLIDFKTDNATIPTDWELIISSYTRFHKKQELIYLHKGSDSLNRQIRKNPRIITFAYKTDYDENDDLYRHLQQLTSQPVNEDSRMESEVTV